MKSTGSLLNGPRLRIIVEDMKECLPTTRSSYVLYTLDKSEIKQYSFSISLRSNGRHQRGRKEEKLVEVVSADVSK